MLFWGQGRALFFCSAVSAAVYIYDIIPHFRPCVKADVKNTREKCAKNDKIFTSTIDKRKNLWYSI